LFQPPTYPYLPGPYPPTRIRQTFHGADWKQMTLLTAFLSPWGWRMGGHGGEDAYDIRTYKHTIYTRYAMQYSMYVKKDLDK